MDDDDGVFGVKDLLELDFRERCVGVVRVLDEFEDSHRQLVDEFCTEDVDQVAVRGEVKVWHTSLAE
ncbi:hypothetical protein O0235_07885 [Tepidiforma flava]|uniref:Uncharacterized protein n=1 Tax=Tepidiforma flava TaxID=3004094 RepID=A0ABY7M1S6_9CHLR|nr:hypothetical protein [Tepidiforma flava]WBL34715.1 hypothetical protein O0235_07885 [Tepidiforma flava]